jgi:hypothetical protein
MKLGLCVFFNYPFPANIPIWRELYGDLFDEMVFIQPLVRSTEPDVVTVYRAAFNFAGYFSDARAALESMDVDAVVFTGDDCVLNPALFGDNFASRFHWGPDVSGFIPEVLPFANENWLRNRHKLSVLGRFVGGYGFYDQRIQGWQAHLPEADRIRDRYRLLQVAVDDLTFPPEEEIEKLTGTQREIIRRTFRGSSTAPQPYPLSYAISDFFIVSKSHLPEFCHQAGLLAAMNVFPEAAVPMALVSLEGTLRQARDCGLRFEWTYGRNPDATFFVPTSMGELRDCIQRQPDNSIFIHPVKMSSIRAAGTSSNDPTSP